MANDTNVNVITEGIVELLERQAKQGKILAQIDERKELNVTKVLAALEQVLDLQEEQREKLKHQDRTLIGLEQRPVPDIAGLARRLEEVADAVERVATPARISRLPRWKRIALLSLAVLCGYGMCWWTVRWLPSGALPPGFSRPEPRQAKGKF